MAKIRVLIVDDIPETRENLRKLLSFDPDIEVVGAAATGEDGVQLARETKPDIVLMDINLPGIDGITATEQIKQRVPSAQIIILSVQGETGYMRRAMAAGARDFLVKPPSGDELMSTIRRVYEIGVAHAAQIAPAPVDVATGAPRRRGRRGRLITVFAPKGGVGCTMIAINLAVALQVRLGATQKIAVLDGNLQFGDVAVMFNLHPTRTIADLADRLDMLDGELLNSVMTPHPSGVKAMLAPPNPEMAEAMMGRDEEGNPRIRTILRKMIDEFDWIIADTWSWVDDVTITLLDEATFILMVITPLIPSIKDARNFMDLASQLGYPMDKLALVINNADIRGGIRIDQIEKALLPATIHLPFDERAGVIAANRGLPIVTEEVARPLAQAFGQLAAVLVEKVEQFEATESEQDLEAEDSRRMLGRIF
ncbi:MAG: response regulator [Anaerolineae bacterium]|nr:response regulator [Anaerolineae bacterium]